MINGVELYEDALLAMEYYRNGDFHLFGDFIGMMVE